jgi:hypothetical protein
MLLSLGVFMAWSLPPTVRLAIFGTTTNGQLIDVDATTRYEEGRTVGSTYRRGGYRTSNYEYIYRFQAPKVRSMKIASGFGRCRPRIVTKVLRSE